MSELEASRLYIEKVLDRFPEDAELIRRLAVENETFLGACEDYTLARATLAQLRGLEQEGDHPRVEDYISLVEELEKELSGMIMRAR